MEGIPEFKKEVEESTKRAIIRIEDGDKILIKSSGRKNEVPLEITKPKKEESKRYMRNAFKREEGLTENYSRVIVKQGLNFILQNRFLNSEG